MTEFLSTLKRRASRPAVRRVLAVDEGSRQLRLLLAEATHSGATILREQSIDLIDEGLVAPEEIRSHLDGVIDEWGSPPTALSAPQHVSTSQIIELPADPRRKSKKPSRKKRSSWAASAKAGSFMTSHPRKSRRVRIVSNSG